MIWCVAKMAHIWDRTNYSVHNICRLWWRNADRVWEFAWLCWLMGIVINMFKLEAYIFGARRHLSFRWLWRFQRTCLEKREQTHILMKIFTIIISGIWAQSGRKGKMHKTYWHSIWHGSAMLTLHSPRTTVCTVYCI